MDRRQDIENFVQEQVVLLIILLHFFLSTLLAFVGNLSLSCPLLISKLKKERNIIKASLASQFSVPLFSVFLPLSAARNQNIVKEPRIPHGLKARTSEMEQKEE